MTSDLLGPVARQNVPKLSHGIEPNSPLPGSVVSDQSEIRCLHTCSKELNQGGNGTMSPDDPGVYPPPPKKIPFTNHLHTKMCKSHMTASVRPPFRGYVIPAEEGCIRRHNPKREDGGVLI